MRTLTANASSLLSQNMGTELMAILEVEWVDNGSILYSDQDVAGCQTKVVSVGGFDTSMILEGSSDSQELSIVLDDTDGSIRQIYAANDIHKRPARMYLLHRGLPLTDKILVFKGELVTPIEWDETQRSVAFHILSKLNNTQVGFSMEEGDFPNIPDEALGKAWPLVFGQVCHVPAVKVRAPRRGYLLEGVGIPDPTLDARICQALKLQCAAVQTGSQTRILQYPDGTIKNEVTPTIGPDISCLNRRFAEICRLRDDLNNQNQWSPTSFEVYNGVSFPQGVRLTLYVDGADFDGIFTGNSFNAISRSAPCDVVNICRKVDPLTAGMVDTPTQIGGSNNSPQPTAGHITQPGGWVSWAGGGTGLPTDFNSDEQPGTRFTSVQPRLPTSITRDENASWVPTEIGSHFTANQTTEQAFESCDEALGQTPGIKGGPADSWDYYNAMEECGFFWAPAGTEVFIEEESEILFIVSLIPGTVDTVSAYRTAPNGFKYLTEVPEEYYTVYETDYQGYQVVEIGMSTSLSRRDDTWDDEIYVSFTSTVGPNPCDIIEWLVNKYTNLTIDAASFASVHTSLTNYPTNFYLIDRPDVYDLIQDIAYQSRCAVYVRNDVVFIRYLSTEPSSVRTLSEDDILVNSFVEQLSETEDVYTTHNVTWRKAGAVVRSDEELDRKIILKYNVRKYGTVEEDWDYFCHNIYELALKTSTFWLIRKANSWRRVTFDLPVKHIDLDVGDCVTLNVQQFSSTPVKSVIESMTLSLDTNTVQVACWSPIRSGETSPFYWAWPAAQSAAAIWPLADDNEGGGGYDFEVTPPIGHILLGGAHRNDQLIITTGDLHPSDVDDTLPVLACEYSDYLDFEATDPTALLKSSVASLTGSVTRSGVQSSSAGGTTTATPTIPLDQGGEEGTGGGSSGGGDNSQGDDGAQCYNGPGCNYHVKVFWHTSLTQGTNCGGPCECGSGCPTCSGPVWLVCHTYGTVWAAKLAAQNFWMQYGKEVMSEWECGETGVVLVQVEDGQMNGTWADDCESVNGEYTIGNAVNVGEITTPRGLTGDELLT